MDISHFIHLFIILWTFEWIFHFWAIMNNATINTDIQDFVWNLFFIFLVSEIAGSYGNSMFNLLKNDHQTVFQNGWTIFYSHQHWKKFQFSHILPTLVIMEKAMAPHSSTLAWKIPWTEEPGGLQSMGSQRVGHDWVTSLSRIGEGNGNSLQWSCLENPRDGGAWWAAVYGVTQNRTWLKWLSIA